MSVDPRSLMGSLLSAALSLTQPGAALEHWGLSSRWLSGSPALVVLGGPDLQLFLEVGLGVRGRGGLAGGWGG